MTDLREMIRVNRPVLHGPCAENPFMFPVRNAAQRGWNYENQLERARLRGQT